MENLASFRSAQSVDCAFYIPVRAGIINSFHFVEHRQVQLAGWALATFGFRAAYVVAAGRSEALALIADGSGRLSRPLPEAAR